MKLAALVAWLALSPVATTPDLAGLELRRGTAETIALPASLGAQRLTAVVFYAESCPCFAAHAGRLQAIMRELGPKGVRFLFVDSERHAAAARVPDVVPGLGAPLYRDVGGRLAKRLDAAYATETFVFDATGALRYRGGVDDDRRYLRASARPLLRDALAALLAGSAPPFSSTKALGCALRLR